MRGYAMPLADLDERLHIDVKRNRERGQSRTERTASPRELECKSRFGHASDALERRVLAKAEQLAKVLCVRGRSPKLSPNVFATTSAGRCAANCSQT